MHQCAFKHAARNLPLNDSMTRTTPLPSMLIAMTCYQHAGERRAGEVKLLDRDAPRLHTAWPRWRRRSCHSQKRPKVGLHPRCSAQLRVLEKAGEHDRSPGDNRVPRKHRARTVMPGAFVNCPRLSTVASPKLPCHQVLMN
jgi:hypothetical protein